MREMIVDSMRVLRVSGDGAEFGIEGEVDINVYDPGQPVQRLAIEVRVALDETLSLQAIERRVLDKAAELLRSLSRTTGAQLESAWRDELEGRQG